MDAEKATNDYERFACKKCGGSWPSCCTCAPAKPKEVMTITRAEFEAAITAARQEQREADAEIVGLARTGDIDSDLRSIQSAIRSGIQTQGANR